MSGDMRGPGPRAELPDIDDDDAWRRAARPTPVHWLLLALAAARRRKALAVAVFAAGVAASIAYYRLKTPVYRVETKILVQRQQALVSMVRPAFEEIPTRSAWDTIHRRENIIALIREADLLPERVGTSRRGLSESLAVLAGRARGPEAEDPLDTMISVLDKRLVVGVEDATITIQLDWPNARQGYEIVQAALQNYLEARHVQEVKAIDEVISVLQGRAAALRQELDTAVEEARRRGAAPRVPLQRARHPSEELVRLQSLLAAKQRAIQDVEEFRRRRLADLQAQLERARNSLSDAHPTVIGLRKDIEVSARESPQIEALREEERRIRKDYNERLAREGLPAAAVTAPAGPSALESPSLEEDQRVRQARVLYEQMLMRVNAAQVELDAARAAFKYRYTVNWPPQMPREPVSPNPRKIFPLGALASLLLALFAAALPDLWSGRIVQRWQVERSLGIPVLGDVRRRS